MCGIVGLVKRCRGDIVTDVIKMRDKFSYRGPDDKGVWVHPYKNVALGHRRLSILDPTPAGQQPMHDQDLAGTIVFNGEIYNYIEIREELRGKGCEFITNTDTEVILKAYRVWGKDCLHRFNGMFAFALWDEQKQEMFLARDRLGIKPLYTFEDKYGFYFASEVKAILAVLRDRPLIQHDLIDSYMSFGYIPGEYTLHKGLKRLLPGHFMVVSSKKTSVEQYWDIHFDNNMDRGENYYLEKGSHLLNNAIDLHLRSDVPLGIFLSGGIDSSAVVGLLAPRVTEPLKTFSVAYDFGKNFNETEYARLVAQKFGTDHYEIFINPQQFVNFIPEYIRLMDEPVTEAAAISLYFLSKLAKEQVTVVLSGEGSDEIFGGYDLYRYMAVLEKYHSIVGAPISRFLEKAVSGFLPQGNKLSKYLSLAALPLEKRYKGISTYDESIKNRLYRKDFAHMCQQEPNACQKKFLAKLFANTKNTDCLSRMLYFDTKTWLVDDLLIKADRMSMAASLELRVPFLDYRLVEFAAAMPSSYKIRKGEGKYLLKKMMASVLPEQIIYRKKMGFPTPLKLMFENDLYVYARDILLAPSAGINSYFETSCVKKLLKEHVSQRRDHHRVLWQLLVLELWLQGNGCTSHRVQ